MMDSRNLLAAYRVQTYRSEHLRQKLLQSEVSDGSTTNREIKILEKTKLRHKENEEKFYAKQFFSGNSSAPLNKYGSYNEVK
jgi:hypothetical protein